MTNSQTDPLIVTLQPTTVAALRETVRMDALPDFFDRAFHAVTAAATAQGVAIAGPPLGIYFSMPTDTVDVAAGFPTSAPVGDADDVSNVNLPGGRAVQLLHVGPYDTLERAYGALEAWVAEQSLALGPFMWETYLNEPVDPATTQTLIVWPLAD